MEYPASEAQPLPRSSRLVGFRKFLKLKSTKIGLFMFAFFVFNGTIGVQLPDWFSFVAHFAGGVLAALFTSAIWENCDTASFRTAKTVTRVGVVIGGVCFAGVWWEIYEYIAFDGWALPISQDFFVYRDTMQDFIMNFVGCGAALVWLFIIRRTPQIRRIQ